MPDYKTHTSTTNYATFSADDIKAAAESMRTHSGIILYPTDTIWGIGCDATDSGAVERIYRLKQRTEAKAMISLVSDISMLQRYTHTIPEVAIELIEQATTPITLVLDSPKGLSDKLLAEDGSAAFRVTTDPFCQAICKALRHPLVSTSANISGQATAATFAQIAPQILSGVDYIAQWRQTDTTPHTPSSVIKISNDSTFTILRP